MSNKNKFYLSLIFLVFLPLVITSPGLFTTNFFGFFYYSDYRSLIYLSNIISLFTLIMILHKNKHWRILDTVWKVVIYIFFAMTLLVLYSFYSLSHFGF